jgi:hypothetical protein
MKTIATLVLLFTLAGTAVSQPRDGADPACFGTWKNTGSEGVWRQVTLGADTLVWLNVYGEGYTITGLSWEAIDEPNRNTDYPRGYRITGTLDSASHDGVTPPKPDGSREAAAVGEQALDVWYIGADGRSLAWANVFRPHFVYGSQPFVKVPAAEGITNCVSNE